MDLLNYLTWIFNCLATHFCWVSFLLLSFSIVSKANLRTKSKAKKMSFTGTLDKCKACDKTVYFVDLLTADGVTYHKTCFRCSHCNGMLVVCVVAPVLSLRCQGDNLFLYWRRMNMTRFSLLSQVYIVLMLFQNVCCSFFGVLRITHLIPFSK